ncbi:MAG: D-alanyl-D-alanine carboxypeptidase/D-alanyl-D-alanine-endopeptidase [Paracoccaceae bacterium]|jgi:D-alanyl-D-alanine carboxypeptidase/D-alanyl-D-alanine-endopeptidase (penicillin-binding protein 4)
MDRRLFIASVVALPSLALAEPPSTAVRPAFRSSTSFRRSAGLLDVSLSKNTSFALFDAENGEMLDSYQPDMTLPPASVTKIVTAIYARSVLGADYRFVTRLLVTGPTVNGIVQGDLYLVGRGDPALDTDELAELASAAVDAGVHGISGRFVVDHSALPAINQIDPDQPVHLGYNPSISGLNLNFNRVFFGWKQTVDGYNLTLDARAVQNKPLVRWIGIRAEDRGAPVFKYSKRNGRDHWSVARSALGKEGGRWLPVRQTADYAGEVFRTLASVSGLKLPVHERGVAPISTTELARFESNPMDEVLRWMLKYSNNLTAECIGLTATQTLGHVPSSLLDSTLVMEKWVQDNLGVAGVKFENHSGLTDLSRVSAAQMAGILAHRDSQSELNGLLKRFNLLDRRGDLMEMDGTSIVAKTGTLNFTRGLAGYFERGGRKYSFAIFTADLAERKSIPLAQRERPPGAKNWSGKAKRQEQALLRHWLENVDEP